jgi:hypothetical protein
MFGRRQFGEELRKRGSWLANGQQPADPPPWVQRWSKYWDDLKTNPEYRRLQEEARAARDALHSPEFEQALQLLQLGLGNAGLLEISDAPEDILFQKGDLFDVRITFATAALIPTPIPVVAAARP